MENKSYSRKNSTTIEGTYIMRSVYNKGNKASDKLIDMLENELVSYENVVNMCMCYMSEDDIADMMDANELTERFFEDNI